MSEQRKHFSSNLTLLATEIQNYQGNLALVNSLPHCSPVAGNWSGSGLPASTRFGGGQICTWNVLMDNVHISLSVAPDGRVIGGNASATMHEMLVSRCPPPTLGTRQHSYTFAGGTTNGNSIQVNFNAASGNAPRCTAHFSGTISGGHLNGTLTFHRIDMQPALNWTTQHQIH